MYLCIHIKIEKYEIILLGIHLAATDRSRICDVAHLEDAP